MMTWQISREFSSHQLAYDVDVMDVHAAAIAIASQVAEGRISSNQAVLPLLVACSTSTAAKLLFAATTGTRAFAARVIPGLVVIVVAAWSGAWFVGALG